MHRLFDFLFPPRADERLLRAVAPDDFLALLSPRLVPATRPGTVALFPYSHEAVRAVIHEAKYHGSAQAFDLLARALADYLHDLDAQERRVAILPVPLGSARRRERGFNQAEEVVRAALDRLEEEGRFSLESGVLKRIRETDSQVSLPRRAREENMRGAFGTAQPADPAYVYIVFDDVVTTGATLQAAIDALKEAGAENILPLALAH